jgi:iron complex outermembrane receptor protein
VQGQLAQQQRLGPDTVATKDPNFVSLDTYTIANTTTAELSDNLSLKNVVAYQHSQSLFVLNNGAILYDFAAPLSNPDTGSQVSEEAQVQGKSFNDKLDWIFGVFYSHQDDANINNNTIFKNYNPFTVSLVPYAIQHFIDAKSTDDSTAVYAHGTYDLGDFVEGLRFNGGFRYTWDERQLLLNFGSSNGNFGPPFGVTNSCPLAPAKKYPNCASPPFNGTYKSPSWTVGFDYQLTDKVMLYVASRRGFKSGGFNPTTGIPDTQAYKPETVTDVELGVKADWLLGSVPLRTNLSVYRGQFNNSTVPLLPVYQGQVYQVLENVKGANIRGAEFEFSVKPIPQLDISGSYSLTVSEYNQGSTIATAYGNGGVVTATEDLSGQPVTQSSKHTAQVSARYDFMTDPKIGDFSVEADYAWRSAQLIPGQGGGDAKLPPFGIVNLRADLTDVGGLPLDVSLWVKNVTDKRYITTQQLFVNVLGANQVTYGNPRTIGGSLVYRW